MVRPGPRLLGRCGGLTSGTRDSKVSKAGARWPDLVYDTLGKQIGYETRLADVCEPWFVLGTLGALLAAALALTWNQRLPA